MQSAVLVAFGFGLGATLTGVLTIPAEVCESSRLESELHREQARRAQAEAERDRLALDLRTTHTVEQDAARRQLVRDPLGPAPFPQAGDSDPADLIPPAGVWVPARERKE